MIIAYSLHDDRNLLKASPGGTTEFPPHLTVRSSLQCRICLRSYKIFYVSQTEDLIFRRRATVATPPADRDARKAKFADWLDARTKTLEIVVEERQKEAETKKQGEKIEVDEPKPVEEKVGEDKDGEDTTMATA